MLEFLKESKIKKFIIAESNKQHQLGKPLVKALNEFIDRTLAASITQASHDKQSRLETPALINKQLSSYERPDPKTKPDLPFLHLSRLVQRIEELSKSKIAMDKQFVVRLNCLLLSVLLSTIKGTTECRINKPILISDNKGVSQHSPVPPSTDATATAQAIPVKRQRLPASSVAVTEPESSVDSKQQRQTKTVKIGLHLSKTDLTATCQFFTIRDIARIETTVRERIFKGLLDSGFDLSDLEKSIEIEVALVEK